MNPPLTPAYFRRFFVGITRSGGAFLQVGALVAKVPVFQLGSSETTKGHGGHP